MAGFCVAKKYALLRGLPDAASQRGIGTHRKDDQKLCIVINIFLFLYGVDANLPLA